jgi:hypothetical protein
MMEAVSTPETSVNIYQTTRRNIPEDSHFHTRRRENLKSHPVNLYGQATLRYIRRFEVLRIKKASHRPDDGDRSTPETSVNIYRTTRRNIPEDSHFIHTVPTDL